MSKFVFTAMFRVIITQPPLNFRFSVAHRRGKKIIVILQEDVTKEDIPPSTLSDFVQNKRLVSFKSIPIIYENVLEITQNASIYTNMCLFE